MRYFSRTQLSILFAIVMCIDLVFAVAAWRERSYLGLALGFAFVPLDAYVVASLASIPDGTDPRFGVTSQPVG